MSKGGEFRFNVSDAVAVPLRGMMLRLRLLEGTPSVKDLGVGRSLRVTSPAGETHELVIKAHSVTAGKQTQERLDRWKEFDVIVDAPSSPTADKPVEIGWTVTGPVESRG